MIRNIELNKQNYISYTQKVKYCIIASLTLKGPYPDCELILIKFVIDLNGWGSKDLLYIGLLPPEI